MLTVKVYLVALCLGHAIVSRVAGCQGYKDCSLERGENCYKNMCLNATEAMQIAFDIGQLIMIIHVFYILLFYSIPRQAMQV